MNYKIINDSEELLKFIDWLPELGDNQSYYATLIFRRKYSTTPELKVSEGVLRRFISSKRNLYNEIKKLEVEIGSYECNGIPINEGSFVLYIMPNPRDMHKASAALAKEIINISFDGRKIKDPSSMAMSMISQYGIGKVLDIDVDFIVDVDDRDKVLKETLSVVYDFINEDALTIVETNGGYHFLIVLNKVSKEYVKKWYNGFRLLKSEYLTFGMKDNSLLPIPGCIQGKSVPKVIKY